MLTFEHTAYNVTEPAKQAQWWIDHMGLTLLRRVQNETDIHFIGDVHGKLIIELYNNPKGAIPNYAAINEWTQHIAFTTENIAAERARLIAAGATPEGEIGTVASGDAAAFVRDPWGLMIQLITRIKPLR
jgi:catechol 2,3-dioxygenase-like lactoylglutathione lyase family enzyme